MHIWSVSDISSAISGTLIKTFGQVAIKGEVSNVSRSSLGHIHFSLKDESAMVNAICFAFIAKTLSVRIENGMSIVAYGKLTCYQERSQYQLQVQTIKLDGLGDMMRLFNERKEEMKKLGYFDEQHKKTLPRFPKRVGLITSESGAVIHDICSKMEDKFGESLLIYNASVQGEDSPRQIIAGIDYFENNGFDLILIARGGGSFEDLFCFNDSMLIKRIFDCKIPIVSAIGHETDFTLCDFVSDIRASTPTHAASLIFPTKSEILSEILLNKAKLEVRAKEKLDTAQVFLDLVSSFRNNFEQRINQYNNFLKISQNSLKYFIKNAYLKISEKGNIISFLILKIKRDFNTNIDNKSKVACENLTYIGQKSNEYLAKKEVNLENIFQKIKSSSPREALKRGYSIILGRDGRVIRTIADLKKEHSLKVKMQDGETEIFFQDKT